VQRTGTDLSITFEATRVTTLPPGTTPDYSNALSKIHINNWTEVNELNFAEFVTGCCTPIDAKVSVQFTVDHEEMNSGGWSLGISSCGLPPQGDNITPGQITTLFAAITAAQTSVSVASSAGFPLTPFSVSVGGTGEIMSVTNVAGTVWTVARGQAGTAAAPAAAGATLTYPDSGAGVTLTPRGGFGTIVVDTSTWPNCSYTVTLSTRPGLTDGLSDRGVWPNSLTFAICNH
jgi:hypothetical protein